MVNASSPSIFYVNPTSGQDSGRGSQAQPYKSITRALQQTKAGDTIQLATGTYSPRNGEQFPLDIPPGVIVVGDEVTWGKNFVIEGSGAYSSPAFVPQNVTVVMGDRSELRGVTVINRATNGTGVWIEAAAPTVAHSTFINCGREGVFIASNARPAVVDNVFEQNVTSGISLVRNAKGELYRNIFRNTGYGITIGEQAAPLLTANTATQNRAGVVVWGSARPVLRRNRLEGNQGDGLVVMNEAIADIGHPQDLGYNIFRSNSNFDLNNATSTPLASAGNDLNPARVQGRINFLASEIREAATPTGTVQPAPTPSPVSPTPGPTPSPGGSRFTDMVGHWSQPFVNGLSELDVVQGFLDGTFRPDAKVTRAQYAAILVKAFPGAAIRPPTNFSDVAPNFWAYNAIRQANAQGFLAGFPDGSFRPDLNLTRVQAIVALVNGLRLTGGTPNALMIYRDRAQIPSYAVPAIATATQRRMVVNYPTVDQLNPMRDIVRGEMAALVYQALVAAGQAKAVNSPYIVRPDTSNPLFADSEGHWAEPFIRSLSNQGLINGFADGTFQPDRPMTRAQYAALVVNAFDPEPQRPATQFTDVPASFWAAKAIQIAYRGGFLSGFPDQSFGPDQTVSRVQVLVSLVSGLGLGSGSERLLSVYTDQADIPGFARPLVAKATEKGLVVNAPDPKHLQPNQPANRGDVAAMVYQARVITERSPALSSPYIVKLDPAMLPADPPSATPAPDPTLPSPAPTPPSNRPIIILDPGHGGTDPGAVGREELQEKQVVLDIALQLAPLLEQQGFQAILTRSDDRTLELAPRVALAEQHQAKLFISIHGNAISLSRPEINGLETYHYPGSQRSAALAEAIHRQILQTVSVSDRGVRQANFYVLRETSMPAVLIEVGFVTGEDDAPRLADPAHRQQLAQASAHGIMLHLKTA